MRQPRADKGEQQYRAVNLTSWAQRKSPAVASVAWLHVKTALLASGTGSIACICLLKEYHTVLTSYACKQQTQ